MQSFARYPLEIVFAGIENGLPVLDYRHLEVDDAGRLTWGSETRVPTTGNVTKPYLTRAQTITFDSTYIRRAAFYMGIADDIAKRTGELDAIEDIVKAAKRGVVIEIEASIPKIPQRTTTQRVGGPISVLVIERGSGARWIEQGTCPAINK